MVHRTHHLKWRILGPCVSGAQSGEFQSRAQDIVQRIGAGSRNLQVFALLSAQRSLRHQVGHAQDAREWRPDLMVQAGEEFDF